MANRLKSPPIVEALCEFGCNRAQEVAETRQEPLAGQPRTDLGKKLAEIRARIVASGAPLLDWDEIAREVAMRRGESRGA